MELWEKFQSTGSIFDYLNYTAQKGNYDSQRCCPVSEAI